MSYKVRVALLLTVLAVFLTAGCGQNLRPAGAGSNRMRFEHIAMNVQDPVKAAQWYRDNLGMKVLREGQPPDSKRFLSDPGRNMMFEFYYSKSAPVPDYASIHNHQMHIAFMVDDVKGMCERLIKAGARLDGKIEVTPDGDEIAIVRDPWGIPLQFVRRAQPLFSHN